MNKNVSGSSSNSKTLPNTRKFAQFNNTFERLDKQQKQIEKLQQQQQQQYQQQQQQLYNSQISSKHQEFINPFPYYRNYAPSTPLNNLNNYVIQKHQQQHQQSLNQRQYYQNVNIQNKSFKNRNHLLLHKLESSCLNKNINFNEPFSQNNLNKKNSYSKCPTNNNNNNNNNSGNGHGKRRSTQVYNL